MKNEPKSPLDGDSNLLAALRYAPIGVCCFDPADNCIFINPVLEEILGLTLLESLGQGYTKTIFPEDLETLNTFFKATATNPGQSISLSFRVNHPIKGTRYCRVNSGAVPDKKGIVKYRIGYVQDETDEQALIKAKEAAEKSARDKFDFLSTMSHEIRTPLNGIIGIIHLLKMNYHPGQEEYIDGLVYSSEHLLQLINDIMDLNRIETENLELHFSEVDIAQLIQQIKVQLNQQAVAKGLWLNTVVDLNTPRCIMADPIRISQILNNLISNAIKYTEKGDVVVSVLITAETADNVTLGFSVKDTGIGIPPELHETIFESFRHLHTTSSHRLSGSGLGLAITRRLITMQGGQILLTSSPGKGSTFSFDLTFEKVINGAGTDKSLQNEILAYAGKFSWLQVLLVEDTSVNIMVADNQLRYFGITPDVATNGNDAANLLQSITYDVALIDLHIPGMDGYALGRLIKQQYPGVQVVIVTANILTDVRTRFADLDITHFLNKPFLPGEMLATLLKITHSKNK